MLVNRFSVAALGLLAGFGLLACDTTVSPPVSETMDQPVTRDSQYSYRLAVQSVRLNHEYGVNDVISFGEKRGGSHYYQAPIDPGLKNGLNTAYFRFSKAHDTPEPVQPTSPEHAEQIHADDQFEVNAQVSLSISNVDSGESELEPLLNIVRDPISGEFTVTIPKQSNTHPVFKDIYKHGLKLIKLDAEPEQGKLAGYKVQFNLNDTFLTRPYAQASKLELTPELEKNVKAKMRQLLKLFQARDVPKLMREYGLSFGHVARTYTYGTTGEDYARSIGLIDQINDQQNSFSLDFEKSLLRLQANKKLVGYAPGVLKMHLGENRKIRRLGMFFMLDDHGNLRIAR